MIHYRDIGCGLTLDSQGYEFEIYLPVVHSKLLILEI